MRKIVIAGSIFLFLLFLAGATWKSLFLLAPILMDKADEAFIAGKYDRAVQYLTVLTWMPHETAECHILKAWLEWSEAKNRSMEGRSYDRPFQQAAKTYAAGRKDHPDSWQIIYEEGMMWDAFKEKEKARECYRLSKECRKRNGKMFAPVAARSY